MLPLIAVMEKKKLNMLLWPVALLLLNGIWVGISDNSAPYEINDFDHPLEERTVTLAAVFGQSKQMPSQFEVEFKGVSTSTGNVSWELLDQDGVILARWSGQLADDAKGWEGELAPGTYRIKTTADEGILAEQTLYIQPFQSYQFEGHVALSMLLISVALVETVVRKKGGEWLANRTKVPPAGEEKTPFKRRQVGMPEYDEPIDGDDPWRTPKGLM